VGVGVGVDVGVAPPGKVGVGVGVDVGVMLGGRVGEGVESGGGETTSPISGHQSSPAVCSTLFIFGLATQ